MKLKHDLNIEVFDYNNQPIDAKIEIHKVNQSKVAGMRRFSGRKLLPDEREMYEVTVSAKGYATQKRIVVNEHQGRQELFILGKDGMPEYYRGNVKVPYEPVVKHFGVVLKESQKEAALEIIKRIEKKYSVRRVEASENLESNNLFLFKANKKVSERELQQLQKNIESESEVSLSKPILKQVGNNAIVLTDEAIVKFKQDVNKKEIANIVQEYHLEVLRRIPYIENGYQFRLKNFSETTMLDFCRELVDSGDVEFAEPNLFSTSEDDVVPTNYMYAEQWDHPIIGMPNAWNTVREALNNDERFGNPDIIIGVVDSGVDTLHPQFNRFLSNGQTKVFYAFDFNTMLPNNAILTSSHGTCCASAAAGMATISSGGGGVPDGTVGIAGNCSVVAVRRHLSNSGSEALYADMYIWLAGFDPDSVIAGFPDPLSRGVDVITNSFGYSIGVAISGLMSETFDFITTYGRNGRGTPMFFSAGNQGAGGCTGAISTLLRPWGSYVKCMSVTASSLEPDGVTEVLAQYSNFGPKSSFCAPSNNDCSGEHNPPVNYGAFTATLLNTHPFADGNTLRNQELQTNIVNIVAGVPTPVVAGAMQINVVSVAGMVVGQSIIIGNPQPNISTSEIKTIIGITPATNTINFSPPLFASKNHNTVVNYGLRDYKNNFGGTSYATPVVAGITALMLSVNPNLTWLEIRQILRDTAVKIDPNNADPIGNWVDENGLKQTEVGYMGPFFSQFYGYGRVNAAAAVLSAKNYEHSWRDLMIRDYLGDYGTTNTQVNHNPIHSPDIWVRNTDEPTAPVPSFNQDGPHENPKTNNDRYIYVRVKNIGNGNSTLPASKKLKNLDAWIHVYVALTDKNIPDIDPVFNPSPGINSPFLFPGNPASQNTDIASKSWSDGNIISEIISDDMKVYHIEHTSSSLHSRDHIEPNTIPQHDPANPEASSYVVRVKWDELDVPPVSTNHKIYLLAYVSPVDGERQGRGAELNNNMSFREIAFADFEFLDAPGTGALKTNISVNEFGTNESTSFNVKVNQSIGSFETEDVTLEIIRERANGTTDHLIFLYNDSTSAWEILNMNNVTVPITWSNITPPTETATGNPATTTQTSITFTGDFDVSKEFSKVKIKTTIRGERDNTLWVSVAEDTYEMSVIEEASAPTGLIPSPGQPPLFPQSYTFTDFADLNTQPANLAFGPSTGSETNKFRVTSSFTASTDVNAYAMVNGFVMIQPGATTDKVNLILRPFTQPIPGFSKVKYIIYRGLRLDEFIDTNDDTKVVAENSSSNSEWITQLYTTHHNLNPGGDFLSKALGYDPSNQSGSDLIDDYFFSTNADFQLPFISRGMQLGKFFANGGSSDFGIDIILEDRKFIPNLDYARTAFHEIDITGLPSGTNAEKFTKRIKQDEILNFMDPAAFYGIHHTEEGKVRRRNGSNNTETIPLADLYSDVIDKFATRNAVYIDIRNELGDSLNFFTNYNDGSGNQIQFGTESSVLTPMAYHEHGWPILIKDNASTPFDTDNNFNEIFLQLRVDDNLSPMLFVKHGDLSTTAVKNKFVEGDNLISGTNPWTNEIGFTYPNTGTSGAKLNVSWFLKLNYSREIDSNTVYPDTVVQTNYYADNLFGSIDAVQPWDSSDTTQWTVLQPDQYVDGSQSGFGQVSEKGIAVDQAQSTDRVILYANLTDDFASSQDFTPNSGQTSGTNQQESFLTEPMLFKGYNLEFNIINSSPNVTTLRFKPNPDNPVSEQNTQILGLTKNQLDSLKSLSGYDNRYPRTVVFDKLGDFIDTNGKPYSKFKLGVNGLDNNGHYLKQFPTTDLEVYSLDELFFTSTDFASLEPTPTEYAKDVEETNGAKLKHPAKTLTISEVHTAPKLIVVVGLDAAQLSENEKVTVSGSAGNNGTYTVKSVVRVYESGTGYTVIEVKESIPSSASPFGQLDYPETAWEDYFIRFDQNTTITNPPDKMETIVANFTSAVNAVPNNETAPGLLETAVNTYAPMILKRARAFVNENFETPNANPDDRILYWARLKMLVILKSHPYLLGSISDRDRLVSKFEDLSRGYSAVDFSDAGSGVKKILITGFDPFAVQLEKHSIGHNILQSNPSGAAALYLHDKGPSELGTNAKIQTVLFPVRYRDFDNGIIDRFFDQFLKNNEVDMIITLSQGSNSAITGRYDLERFATKYRTEDEKSVDNDNKSKIVHKLYEPDPSDPINGDLILSMNIAALPEFLETNLPKENMVSTIESGYKLQQGNEIYNQGWFEEKDKKTKPYRSPSNPGDANTNTPPSPTAGKVIQVGSGGNYLSNEVFYRVALLREKRNSTVLTGHLHLPVLQPKNSKVELEDKPNFNGVNTKELIQDVKGMVVDGINAII